MRLPLGLLTAAFFVLAGCRTVETAPVGRSQATPRDPEIRTVQWQSILSDGQPCAYLATKEGELPDERWEAYCVYDLDWGERGFYAATGATYRLNRRGEYDSLGNQVPTESIRSILGLPADAEIRVVPLQAPPSQP